MFFKLKARSMADLGRICFGIMPAGMARVSFDTSAVPLGTSRAMELRVSGKNRLGHADNNVSTLKGPRILAVKSTRGDPLGAGAMFVVPLRSTPLCRNENVLRAAARALTFPVKRRFSAQKGRGRAVGCDISIEEVATIALVSPLGLIVPLLTNPRVLTPMPAANTFNSAARRVSMRAELELI